MSAKSGGSGNFPINVIAQAQGLDQVTSQLTRFADMLKVAGSTMQQQVSQMTSLGAAFTKFGQSSTGVNSAITQTSNNLKTLGPSATQAGNAVQQTQTKMTQFMDVTKQTGSVVTQTGNQIKTLGPAATQAGSGVTAAQGKLTQFSEAAKLTGTAATQAGSQVKTLGPSFQAAGSAATGTNGQLNTLTTGLRTVGTTAQTTGTEFRTLGPSVQTAGQNMATATTEANALGTAIEKETQFTANAITNTTRYASVLSEAGMATTDLTTKQELNNTTTTKSLTYNKQMIDGLISGVRHVSAMGLGFMMLNNTMSDNTLVLENIAMQQDKVNEATQRAAQAHEQYGKGSTQAMQADKALAQAKRGLQFETREANAQTHNMMFMQFMIVSEILGSAIPAVLKYQESLVKLRNMWTGLQGVMTRLPATFDKLGSAFQTVANTSGLLPDRFNKAKTAATGLEGAVISNTGKATLFSGAMAGLGGALQKNTKDLSAVKTGTGEVEKGFLASRLAGLGMTSMLLPLGVAAGAGAVAIALYATNAWGFRDAVNGVGKAIGDAVPILSPFLEGIQGIGGALGITGETAEQTKGHFANMSAGFQHMGTLWNDTVAGMQSSNNIMVKSMGDTAAVLGVDMTKAFGDLRNQVGLSITAFNQFTDALGRGDYTTATRMIEEAFAAIPGIIGRIMVDVGTILYDALVGIGKTVGPIITGIGNVMGKQLMDGLTAAWNGIVDLVNKNVVLPIQNAVNGIWTGIKDIAGQVWTKLGLEGMFTTVSGWIDSIAKTISAVGNWVTSGATAVWEHLKLATEIPGMVTTFLTGIGTSITNVGDYVGSGVKAVWDKLQLVGMVPQYLLNWLSVVGSGISNIANSVSSAASAVWTKLQLPNVYMNITTWASNAAALIGGLGKLVGSAAQAVWDNLHLEELLKKATDLGKGIVDNILKGIAGTGKAAQDVLGGTSNAIQQGIGGLMGQLAPKEASGMGSGPPPSQQHENTTQTQPLSGYQLDLQKSYEADKQKNIDALNPIKELPKLPPTTQGPPGGTNSTPQAGVKPMSGQTPQAGFQQVSFNTGQGGGAVQAATNATDQLSKAQNNLGQSFSGPIPQIDSSGKALVDWTAKAHDTADASVQAAATAKMQEANLGFLAKSAKDLGGDLGELNGKIIGNSLALNDAGTKQDIYNAGVAEQVIKQQELEGANIKGAGALEKYNAQIKSGERQNAEYTAGVIEQGNNLNDLIATTSHSVGINATYAQQLTTTKGINAEVNQGYVTQQGELNALIASTYNTIGANAAYSQELANGTMQTGQFNSGVAQQDKMLNELRGSTALLEGTNAKYSAQLANGTMQAAQFTLGQADANKALNEMAGNTAHTNGVVFQYAANLASGKEQAVQFADGQATANMKMLEMAGAAANTQGQLSSLTENLRVGNEQTIQFASGQANMALQLKQTESETANLQGQFESLADALKSTTQTQVEFSNGFNKGRVEMAQQVLEMSNAQGVYAGHRAVLLEMAKGYGDLGMAVNATNDDLTQYLGVLKGAPDAVNGLITSLSSFADEAIGKVAEALNKGKGEVKKAIAEIQTEIQGKLTNTEKKLIIVEAQTENAVNAIQNNISLALNYAANGSAEAFHSAMARAIADAQKQFQSAGGAMKTTWSNILTDMHNIDVDPLNSKKLIDDAAGLVLHLEQVGLSGDKARQMLQGLGLTTAQVDAAMAKANGSVTGVGTSLTGVGTGAQSSDPLVAAFTTTLSGMAPVFGTLQTMAQQTFGQIIPQNVALGSQAIVGMFGTVIPGIMPILGSLQSLSQQTFGTIIPGNVMIGVNTIIATIGTLPGAITPVLGQLQTMAQQTFTVIIPGNVMIGINTVIATINTLPGATAPVLGLMQSMAQQTFTIIGQLANLVATGVNTAYRTAEGDANGYLNSMRATAASIFQAIGSSATAVSTGVNNAYRTAEGDANGYLNSMRTTAANTFQAIGQSAQQVANGVNNAFRTAEQSASSAMNNMRNTAVSAFTTIANVARTAASAVAGIGNSASSAAGQVRSLVSAMNSIPNISRTITITEVHRVVTQNVGFAQFGINTLVDKPTTIIAGEGMGKERVKVSPGTMGFVEDLNRELREKFSGGHSGTASGWGGLGGMGAKITEWVNNFIDKLFHKIGWPFFGEFPGHGGGGGGTGGHGGGGGGSGGGGTGGGGTGGGGGGGIPIPERFLKNPSMKNFGFYPVGHPHAGEPILTAHPGQINNGTLEEPYPNVPGGSGGGTNTGGGTGTGSGGTGNGGGNTNTGGNNNNNNAGGTISQIISQINSANQNGGGTLIQSNVNTGSNIIPMPTSDNPLNNVTASIIQQSNTPGGNINTGSNSSVSSAQTKIIHETPLGVTLEIDGSVLTKKIIKLITQELSNAGVYG